MTQVGALVHRPAVWVDPDSTLREAAGVLTEEWIGAALVRGRRSPAGIVSERDIVRALAEGMDPRTTRVRDIMTEDLLDVPASTPVALAARLMLDGEVRHIVVDGAGPQPHIVSLRDVVALSLALQPED